jgi:hypothetical protein
MTARTTIQTILTHDELLAALAPFEEDYAATLRLTAELPATDRHRARQKRRGAYLRALRQALRTVSFLRDEQETV